MVRLTKSTALRMRAIKPTLHQHQGEARTGFSSSKTRQRDSNLQAHSGFPMRAQWGRLVDYLHCFIAVAPALTVIPPPPCHLSYQSLNGGTGDLLSFLHT